MRRQAARGFTLVEVLVAILAGLFVSLAAFVLARNATRFFQHEARISSAQLSVMLGMERLLADIDRAAHESTPNIQTSTKRCPKVAGGGLPSVPAGLARLSGITIEEGGSIGAQNLLPQSVANAMRPDRLTIGGSFTTTETFAIAAITPGATGGWTVYLQRTSHDAMRATASGQSLSEIFKVGRFLRITEPGGLYEYYGSIVGFDALAAAVQVGPSPLMPSKVMMRTCGVGQGIDVGWTANPVSRVRYDIRSLAGSAHYGALVAPVSAAASGDAQRSELVRVELDADDNEIPGSLELVAEYAVDLKFGISAVVRGTPAPAALSACPNALSQDVYHCPIPMAPNVYTDLTGPVTGGALPELVRSVQVRLVTRARAPDRDADLATGPDGRKYRFRIDLPGVPAPQFARLRTMYAEKYLRNQGAL